MNYRNTPWPAPPADTDILRDCVDWAIQSRRSIRRFLPDPVPRPVIEAMLETASAAASGSNIQPWHVEVVGGGALEALRAEAHAAFAAGETDAPQYAYYPAEWQEPYLGRRRACGFGLYGALGIAREEKARMREQTGRNFLFFDAPLALFLHIDRRLAYGAWIDQGIFLQSLMIAARAHGLHSCAQAAWAEAFSRRVHERLSLPSEHLLVCGLALGYADEAAPENAFITERVPVDEFARFHE